MAEGSSLQAEIILAFIALFLITLVRAAAIWSEAHMALGDVTCFRCNAQTNLIDEHFDALDTGDITMIEHYECPACSHRQLRIVNDTQYWAELENDHIRV